MSCYRLDKPQAMCVSWIGAVFPSTAGVCMMYAARSGTFHVPDRNTVTQLYPVFN